MFRGAKRSKIEVVAPKQEEEGMILKGQRDSSQSSLSQYYFVHPQILHGRVRDLTRLSKLSLILRRSRTGTVWFYTSTSNKRAARPKLYTKSLTRDLEHMYSRFTLVRISINL